MNTICVYYDLNDTEHQYQALIHFLQTFPEYAQAGPGIWFVNSNKSCANIRDDIRQLNIPGGYELMVFKVGDTWSSTNLRQETSEWLHKNLKP